MQRNSNQGDTGITKDEVLDALEQSGRRNFNKRLLTYFSSKKIGLLPELRRTSRSGSNIPVFVWYENVMEQIIDLYDLVERGCRNYHTRLLYLWLRGYSVPFEPILRHWLQLIDTLLQNLTGGEQDPDEAMHQISSSLVTYVEPKWKFSPRPDQFIRDVGIDTWGELMEVFFGMLAVSDYEPDEMASEGVLRTLQRINKIAQTDVDPEETFSWLLSLRDVFTLPRYRDSLINATVEEWMQARDDYLELCQFLHKLTELFPRRSARLISEMRQALFLHWGSILPPLLLAVRRSGYGDEIDDALACLNEVLNNILADPDICKLLAKM